MKYDRVGTTANAKAELAFSAWIRRGTIEESLSAQVAACRLNYGQRVVVVPLSESATDLFPLWLERVREYLDGLIIILTLQEPARLGLVDSQQLRSIDCAAFFSCDESGKLIDASRRHLWVIRTMLIRELVAQKHEVVSLDVDAMLTGNMNEYLLQQSAADVIAQQDFSIPMDVSRTLGFVLCCGCVILRPSEMVSSFLDLLVKRTITELDDQTALNHLLMESGVVIQQESSGELTFYAAGLLWISPSVNVVSRSLRSGFLVRHFHRGRRSVAEIRKCLADQRH